MRYIKGEFTTGVGRQLALQNDGQLWRLKEGTGKFTTGSGKWDLDQDFNSVVDGIYFAKAEKQFSQTKIFFMVPETHFLFNEHMLYSKMFYMLNESRREAIERFATLAVIDIIKTKLGIKI
jgi:hypothetical protein